MCCDVVACPCLVSPFYKCPWAIKTHDGLAVEARHTDAPRIYSGDLKPGTRVQWINRVPSTPRVQVSLCRFLASFDLFPSLTLYSIRLFLSLDWWIFLLISFFTLVYVYLPFFLRLSWSALICQAPLTPRAMYQDPETVTARGIPNSILAFGCCPLLSLLVSFN